MSANEVVSSALPDGLQFRLMHVGVAVAEIRAAEQMFASLFGSKVASGPFNDPIQKVTVNFLRQTTGELTVAGEDVAEIELIAPLSDDAPIQAMLMKTGGGAYHLCFATNNLEAALTHVRQQRCLVVSGPAPATAFGGRRIAWFYTPSRLLIELVEEAQTQTSRD